MFNFGNDIDLYREWANIVVFNRFTEEYSRPYHCAYVGRRFRYEYARSHQEVLTAFGHLIPHHEPINSTFGVALGDYGYLVRSPDLEEIRTIAQLIHEKA
jgi:hypothetical protein